MHSHPLDTLDVRVTQARAVVASLQNGLDNEERQLTHDQVLALLGVVEELLGEAASALTIIAQARSLARAEQTKKPGLTVVA